MVGLYVHVPFCLRKCPYCDFYSIPHEKLTEDSYFDALITDMERYRSKEKFVADTLYFGGGTPSLASIENIARIISAAREIFGLNGEITLEANPNSVTEEKLASLKAAGINRISFGIQSADEKELSALGRLHSNRQAIEAVKLAYNAGIKNISVDIMLGTPYQTIDSVLNTLEVITNLPISHVSAYMLKVEEGTPYYTSKLLQFCADEDSLAEIYLEAVKFLEQKGFLQYEISNFAKPGLESRHNLKYWQCEEYLGFGASAHSFVGKTRFCNQNSVAEYIDNTGLSPIVTDGNAGGLDEYVIMGLRTKKGIDLSRLQNCPEIDYDGFLSAAVRFSSNGFGKILDNIFTLSVNGYLLSNSIISSLLENINIHHKFD